MTTTQHSCQLFQQFNHLFGEIRETNILPGFVSFAMCHFSYLCPLKIKTITNTRFLIMKVITFVGEDEYNRAIAVFNINMVSVNNKIS